MKKWIIAMVALMATVFTGVALAAGLQTLVAEGSTDTIAEFKPVVIYNGFYVGRNKGTSNVKLSKQNKVTGIYSGLFDYDFPAISPEAKTGGHLRTPNLVLNGVQIGDVCIAGSTRTSIDGGYEPDVELRAHVNYANSVVLEAIAQTADAGSLDLADAGYKIMCFSSQTPP